MSNGDDTRDDLEDKMILAELEEEIESMCEDSDDPACDTLEDAVDEIAETETTMIDRNPPSPKAVSTDLWRVGVPSIGETWPRRFSYSRSTGGLGTGVYAFRSENAAVSNVANKPDDAKKEIFHLRNAVENPLQPQSIDAVEALNRLSRRMGLVARKVAAGQESWNYVFEQGEFLSLSLHGGIGGDARIGSGSDSMGRGLLDLLLDTPQLKDVYGLSTEDLAQDALIAAKRAYEANNRKEFGGEVSQPLNHLLWPHFDGIVPPSGAGGDRGMWGCCIFIERIEKCVPDRELEYPDQIDADVLNSCFRRL